MCGIAGIVGAKGDRGIDPARIHAMCQSIVHRGPDDEGIFVKDGAGLGIRRLSIIDVAGGHQPIFNEDGSVCVVLNGEIYNFPELRRQLEARGHRFSTHSDTECVVHLYEEMGADCVLKLRGMFGLAIYDERRHQLLLARDRLGKKPLYYAEQNGRLFFASEIKAILAVAPELATINPPALLQYFYFGYIPDPETSFTAIHKLPPGHLLEFKHGDIRIRKYWDLPEYDTYQPGSEEECLEELERRLSEAVRMRMISDVPLGALLSGGTDSSIVLALMARASSQPVKTFSVGFHHTDFDETPCARLVAERFGADHHELILQPNVVETVESLTRSLEEPFGDSSMLPTYYISCLARKYVTVALSGDGGDETFAGYDLYRTHLKDGGHRRIPRWAGRFYRAWVYPRIPRGVRGRNAAYRLSLPWQERYLEAISLVPFQRQFGLISEDFIAYARDGVSPLQMFRDYLDRAPAREPLSRVLYLDTKTYLAGDILTKVDRMSMATSLEVRAPLLDHVLLEWVTGLSHQWKLRNGTQKYILRRLAERIGVPKQVLQRPKQGFALPLVHWMRHEMRDMMLTVLLEPRTLQRGYFNADGVRRLLEEFFRGRRSDASGLWRLLMFELWHRNFLESFATADAAQQLDHAAALRGALG
jgi:asparagine synthase (glutamine-hydrolysing)